MTESEWLMCDDPRHVLELDDIEMSERKLRLFAVACCRRIWGFASDERSKGAVEVAESFAEGVVTQEQLIEAANNAWDASEEALGTKAADLTHGFAAAATSDDFFGPALVAAGTSSHYATNAIATLTVADGPSDDAWRSAKTIEAAAQSVLLRDIFGNPFRSVPFSPAWRTSTAVALAAQMYESRDFGAMPILADALQDAGCDSADILEHCRDASAPHVRGCWVVDLVLGKE
ncbi:hypothetical protein [Gemmata palustris]|uniref:hypothetical protein n=1 Tax=Gemmata palustris TaxID=2822762 RepID=UPI001FE99D3C|nr:hypothetical protein [Gemmata palustris]